jgi:hypothetical protein
VSLPAQKARRRRGAACAGRAAVGALALAIPLVAACSSSPPFDREAAIANVVKEGGGRLSRSQAECYVDRVANELGTGALTPGTEPSPEQIPRLTAIRVDCIGVASLGTTVPGPPPTATQDTSGVTQPSRPGDDPVLDQLYARCQAGSGAACDELFAAAPIGSEYEQFGLTCGGRSQEAKCADKYPG